MKNYFLSLLLITFIPYIWTSSADIASNNLPKLTPSQNLYLNNLYQDYQSNPSFYKSHDKATIKDDLDLLEKRIQISKHLMIPKNSWPIKKERVILAIISISIATGLLVAEGYEIYTEHKEFFLRQFNTINIPSSLIKNLSSTHFNFKTKRYLKRFSVEKIQVRDWWSSEEKTNSIIDNLSTHAKEKMTYAALNYAITKNWTDIKSKFSGLFIISITFLPLICICLYSAFNYEQMMANQLKKDLKIYNILKKHLETL